jgi:GDPmannose 4,6-dehydratase
MSEMLNIPESGQFVQIGIPCIGMKKAFITGVAGQDGSYMAELLLSKGYEVFGLVQKGMGTGYAPKEVKIVEGEMGDATSLADVIRTIVPDEVYNFAGITDLKTAYAEPELTWRINYEAVDVLLRTSLKVNPKVKFLQASSSEIFVPSASPLNEESPRDWDTKNPYAIAKMTADRDVIQKNRSNGAFACSAILFNHESPRRPETSLLRKVTSTLAKISRGESDALVVGNVEQLRDWGYAKEYVEAMWGMLQLDQPEDFVIASGELHRVQDVIEIAARCVGVTVTEGLIRVSPELFRPAETHPKVGDTSKAKRLLGWEPRTSFHELIELMVRA